TIIQNTVNIVPDTVTNLVCDVSGFTNTVEIVGGTGPFQVRLVEMPANTFEAPNQPPRRHTFNGLQYGVSYIVEVLDESTGCTYLEVIDPVEGPSSLDITLSATPGYCDASRNGQITYTVTGFTGNGLIIELINVDTGERISIADPTGIVLPSYSGTYETLPGNYQLIVTDTDSFCTDAGSVTIGQNLPTIDILAERAANCNAFGSITVQGSGGGGGPYEFAYMPQGTNPTDGDFSSKTTFFGAAGNYDVYVRDINGCTSFDIATVIDIDPILPEPIIDVVNQCIVTATSFQIKVTMPSTINTPRFTLGGETKIGVLNGSVYEADFSVNSPGSYPIDVVDANGCTSQGIAEVYEFLSVSGKFSVMPNCMATDGEIAVEVIGGSNHFSFQLLDEFGGDIGNPILGDRTAGVFPDRAPGNYRVYIEDTETLCNDTVKVTLAAPIQPIISIIEKQNISCNGTADGSIHIALASGTDGNGPNNYRLLDFDTRTELFSNNSGSFADLGQGRYEVEVVTARNCRVLSGLIEIDEPLPFAITASAPDFTCEVGANRYSSTTITVLTTDPGTLGAGYKYSITGFENYQSGNTFEIVDNGSPQNITVYAIDGNGCETFFDLPVINPPTDVKPSSIPVSALDCKNPERVRIEVVGTTNFTVTVNSVVPIAPVTVTGSSFAMIELPAAGDYLFEVTDNVGGCTYPLPKYTVEEPILPTVVISESKPVQCYGVNDGALSIDVSTYIGPYTYNVYRSDDLMATTSIKTGTLNTAVNPDVITGLPGGNFYVVVEGLDAPYCSNTSNMATIRTPNGPLVVEAVEVGNVSCDNNTGRIMATASGGWDNSPFEYALLKETSLDSNNFQEEVPFGPGHEFKDLSSGNYRVVVRDIEGCEDTFDILIDPVDPILAEIREPQGLVCPSGNNAILEAYDPVSGNAGASGGVSGAGYKYQLVYLGSNNINDQLSRSGLQDLPSFEGTTGGFISAGWYAIEVFSSYACIGRTQPYYVNPPPPIQ
ncbi:MAG TPA: SprB repeat-containing protein, partial [Arenibacter sp.]|nr:SprB repeat-containing protein [Arenibacter sp.]